MMMKKTLLLSIALLAIAYLYAPARLAAAPSLRFEVTVAPGLLITPQNGRLFVVMSRNASAEPRRSISDTGLDAPPVLARDVTGYAAGATAVVDEKAIAFPITSLAELPAGDYSVQAVFDYNNDLASVNAPGNLYSTARRIHLDPARGETIKIELTEQEPPDRLPADTDYVKYVRLQSELLTKFHGRPIYLRAGIILPRDFDKELTRRYPLRVQIGGYGTRYTLAGWLMSNGSGFRRTWLADDTPRMVLLQLDGDGPYGDCYQVNSDNNGPYGDAVTQELIPYIEKTYRCIGEPSARVLNGGSTGGWVSLALQVFYPDFFNGTWSGFPDGVDFRAFQLINIYADDNAYVNRWGFERPSMRELNGDVRFTVRHECQMENVLGAGDSWTMSGQQWGAWNATYGPRGADGRPVPLWDPKTGKINRTVTEHWKRYDLRLILERDWKQLAPRLRGKLHIWVGEADNYFLNNAVHLLDDALKRLDPPYEGTIIYGPGKGHGWNPMSEAEMMKEMMTAINRK
ncbi:MAG: alpha/beta hydrolase-fold protein [Blastocatellia bacterium]